MRPPRLPALSTQHLSVTHHPLPFLKSVKICVICVICGEKRIKTKTSPIFSQNKGFELINYPYNKILILVRPGEMVFLSKTAFSDVN